MAKLVLKFEKCLESDAVFDVLRAEAARLSGFLTCSGSSGKYEFMGNPVSIDVGPLAVVFEFMESGVDPLRRPMEAFSSALAKEYGKPHVGLELPESKKAVWAERFRSLF